MLGYMALIWWLSSRRVDVPTHLVPLRDKGVHFVEYATLGGVVARAALATWSAIPVRAGAFAVMVTVCWGLLDELHQAFVPGRSADLADLVADGLGAVAGVLAYAGVLRAWQRWRCRSS